MILGTSMPWGSEAYASKRNDEWFLLKEFHGLGSGQSVLGGQWEESDKPALLYLGVARMNMFSVGPIITA